MLFAGYKNVRNLKEIAKSMKKDNEVIKLPRLNKVG